MHCTAAVHGILIHTNIKKDIIFQKHYILDTLPCVHNETMKQSFLFTHKLSYFDDESRENKRGKINKNQRIDKPITDSNLTTDKLVYGYQ